MPFIDPSIDRLVTGAIGAALASLPAGAKVALAFSGGVDSSVLLDAAVRVAGAARCIALHVHHGLSPNADAWLAHCQAVAAAHGVAFAAQHADVSRGAGHGLEAAARDARYRALEALCREHRVDALWLGQHADDQAETVLLQLLRGSGLAGLAAMAAERLPPGASVVHQRPLLHILRAQLERYAAERDLHWIDDESNTDTRYARNALRHEVMPALAVHFPGFRDALSRTAAHAAAAQGLLDTLAWRDLQNVALDEEGTASSFLSSPSLPSPSSALLPLQVSLSHAGLLALDDDRALNLLRYWIRLCGLPAPSAARLNDAWRQLRAVQGGHALRVDHAGHALRCYRGALYWEAGDSAEPADETTQPEREVSQLVWQGEAIWRLPQWRGTFVFTAASQDDPDAVPRALLDQALLTARSRRGGERMRRKRLSPGRTLKNLFQEQGVPAWRRDVPLLWVGEVLLYVPLLGVNHAALPEPDAAHSRSPGVRIDWREDLLLA
ncbi:tRNA lysidine(34) synthetase TilS [Paraburkholderia hayleyella]|uniref:tRNA lysidine(34) synthetase TilS n=1 Tax=Paraburkholderia hayleyella TaxID=2152889 RepID=UPI0012929E20|nr:tRNA lysidine(34) synthetase TilS [Paraburkholderia hayleyella]